MEILQVSDVKKTYTTRLGGNRVQALKGVTFSVQEGEYVAIMGESGSGKTTLLNILAALDKPTAGEVLLSGKSLETIPEGDLAAFRRDNLGFVFQEFNLLDTFSIEDNILLPLVLAGKGVQEMQQTLLPLARSLGIEDILHKFPYEVSGGQKQRAAVARAMVTHSVDAASHAGRVLFIRDGVVFHQIYRGECSDQQLYKKISDTLTMLRTGRDAE